ncbi:fimbrial protein [Acinetobacter lanii]|uniref:Fimbrial protein n=1 Tax=Acinetobacter lanii TaxID=2715163 RepID=A0A6G8S7V0_9GAMM|nr:fimbrial protein [Acinetobacter lanii]QIO10237.1 fimbrial protein [Acinetobacter lanii]
MKINMGFSLFLIIFSFCSTTHAKLTCQGQLSSYLHADRSPHIYNTFSVDMNYKDSHNIYDFYSYEIKSKNLINCTSDLGVSTGVGKISKFNAFAGNSNIDSSRSTSFDGTGYLFFKIKNTGNEFIDNHAYISFWFKDDLTAWLGTKDFIINSNLINFGQDLNITQVRFYFTDIPTTSIHNIPINIGVLTVNMRDRTAALGGSEVTISQETKIWLNVNPAPIKTCEIDNQTVTLPSIPDIALNGAGAEAGATAFSVVAKCNPQGVARTLTGMMIDNNQVDNTSFVLKNTNTESNVGIKVQDTDLNRPVYYNAGFNFGTTTNSKTYVFITKNFRASYYKLSSDPTLAGLVNSQAIISVSYP